MGNATIGEIIGLIFLIPTIIGTLLYIIININNPDALLNHLPEFIENVATPWEIGILEPLSKMGIMGAILIILFVAIYKCKI